MTRSVGGVSEKFLEKINDLFWHQKCGQRYESKNKQRTKPSGFDIFEKQAGNSKNGLPGGTWKI